jgi:ATP-dependent Lon protease
MPRLLPLFPLNLVVFPHEKLNLHIFEPRYRQLVRDCLEQNLTFGIPPFLDNYPQRAGHRDAPGECGTNLFQW